MAGSGGKGPPPKHPDQRARTNKDPGPLRVIAAAPVRVPLEPPGDLLPDGVGWHPATLRWWRSWAESPLAETLLEVDWHELAIAAVLHHKLFAEGFLSVVPELRLRMAAFGATPADRARLRIFVSEAEVKEAAAAAVPARQSARDRYGDLRAVPAGEPAVRKPAARRPAAKKAAAARAG